MSKPTAGPRTIDPIIPPSQTESPLSPPLYHPITYPRPCEKIPEEAKSLRECALHQIQSLIEKSTRTNVSSEPYTLTPGEEDALDDGFILCDITVVRRKLRAWRHMFPRIKPFFALKCNPDVMVAAELGREFEHKVDSGAYSGNNNEAGFDCASISEIKLALQSTGNNTRRCVYANPQRADSDLHSALSLGVNALTFDGVEELRKVSEAHKRHVENWKKEGGLGKEPQPPEMILRILVPDGASTVPLGEKFGAPPSRIEALVEESLDLGLPVIGVSFHCGSGCHDPEAYGNAIKIAKDALDMINSILDRRLNDGQNYHCTILDIGGGYPGFDGVGGDVGRFSGDNSHVGIDHGLVDISGYDEHTETAYKISQVVTPLVNELFPLDSCPIHIIAEPGRYFVEAAFAYCSRIYSVRRGAQIDGVDTWHYYIAQGVQGLFKDVLLCGENFTPIPLMVNEAESMEEQYQLQRDLNDGSNDEKLFSSTVHGPSGEDFDIICHDCSLPRLKIGDWLIFDRMGAYTLSIAARNSSLPIRYVMGGSNHNEKSV